jgi:hypothetical protein
MSFIRPVTDNCTCSACECLKNETRFEHIQRTVIEVVRQFGLHNQLRENVLHELSRNVFTWVEHQADEGTKMFFPLYLKILSRV